MDILFRRGRATAAEVMAELPGEPTYSTVRTQLRVLEDKGHVRHEVDGVRFVYTPVLARQTARKSALRHLIDTFFDGSAEKAVAALGWRSDRGTSKNGGRKPSVPGHPTRRWFCRYSGGYYRRPRVADELQAPFVQAVSEAVRQWQYMPTRLNNVPVPVMVTVTVSYTSK